MQTSIIYYEIFVIEKLQHLGYYAFNHSIYLKPMIHFDNFIQSPILKIQSF